MVGEIEAQIGRRAVIERVLGRGQDVELRADAEVEAGDEVLLAGPSAAIVAAAPSIGPEIEGEQVMRSIPGEVVEVFVTARDLHATFVPPPKLCSVDLDRDHQAAYLSLVSSPAPRRWYHETPQSDTR